MKEGRNVVLVTCLILVLVLMPFASANIFTDIYAKMTGKMVAPCEVDDPNCNDNLNSCLDSDLGKDYFVKGKVTTSTGYNRYDECSGDYLYEYYCSDEFTDTYTTYKCPNGCANGACLEGVANTESCTDGIKNQGETGIDCGGPCAACKLGPGEECELGSSDCLSGYECVDDGHDTSGYFGICKEVPAIQPTCVDTDLGKSVFTKGKTYIEGAVNQKEDYCYGTSVYEYYCENNEVKSAVLNCENGCENGVCLGLSPVEPTCYDSDNGKNAYAQGYVETSAGKVWDSCKDTKTLLENYCDGTTLKSIDINCLGNCEEGVCLEPEVVESSCEGEFCTLYEGSPLTTEEGFYFSVEEVGHSAFYTNMKYGDKSREKQLMGIDTNFYLNIVLGIEGEIDYYFIVDSIDEQTSSVKVRIIKERKVGEDVCVDSDGGENYFIQGETILNPVYSEEGEVSGSRAVKDECSLVNSSILHEHYCDGNEIVSVWDVYCKNGCVGGACVRTDETMSHCNEDEECVLYENNPIIEDDGSLHLEILSIAENKVSLKIKLKDDLPFVETPEMFNLENYHLYEEDGIISGIHITKIAYSDYEDVDGYVTFEFYEEESGEELPYRIGEYLGEMMIIGVNDFHKYVKENKCENVFESVPEGLNVYETFYVAIDFSEDDFDLEERNGEVYLRTDDGRSLKVGDNIWKGGEIVSMAYNPNREDQHLIIKVNGVYNTCEDNRLVTTFCSDSDVDYEYSKCENGCSDGACYEPGQTQECSGCLIDGTCYTFGYRKSGEYCSELYGMIGQFNEGSTCDNNFECDSNVCVGGRCIDQSLWERIFAWFTKAFG